MQNNLETQLVAFHSKLIKEPGFNAGHISTYLTLTFFWKAHDYAQTFNINPEVLLDHARLDDLEDVENCLRYLEKIN